VSRSTTPSRTEYVALALRSSPRRSADADGVGVQLCGEKTFGGRNLHEIDPTGASLNPYEVSEDILVSTMTSRALISAFTKPRASYPQSDASSRSSTPRPTPSFQCLVLEMRRAKARAISRSSLPTETGAQVLMRYCSATERPRRPSSSQGREVLHRRFARPSTLCGGSQHSVTMCSCSSQAASQRSRRRLVPLSLRPPPGLSVRFKLDMTKQVLRQYLLTMLVHRITQQLS
jgi:hypothetical protein